MAIPNSELQSLTPASIIELFTLELVEGTHYATGNPSSVPTIYRFHAGTNMNSDANIIWQGNTYEKFPIKADGFEFTGTGQIPRPQLLMSNLGGITRSGQVISVTDLLITVNTITPHNDLINAKFTRLSVLASSLDNANFSSGSNPFGTPNTNELPKEEFLIDRKGQENRESVSFDLVSDLDKENFKLPARQVTRADFPAVASAINR